MQFVEKLRSRVGQSLGRLRLTGRIAVILLACLWLAGLSSGSAMSWSIFSLRAAIPKSWRMLTT